MTAGLVDGLDRAVFTAMRHLPTPAGQALAGVLAKQVAPRLYPRLNDRARAAIATLRPDLPVEPTLAALWDATTRMASETACFTRLVEEDRVTFTGEAPLLALRDAGRPLIMAGLHLGQWDVYGVALMRRFGLQLVVMHRPPPVESFRGRVLVAARLASGARLLPLEREATWPALRVLRDARETLYMSIDEITEGRVMAPLLGRAPGPGPNPSGNLVQAVRLARLTGAAIVPGYAIRAPGARFAATILPPIEVARSKDAADDIAAGVAALDAAITPPILAHLDQWFPLLYWRGD
jgi:KDO2-lipid IV(A) lauroyltransferase